MFLWQCLGILLTKGQASYLRANAQAFWSSPYFLHTFELLHTDFLHIPGFGRPSSWRVYSSQVTETSSKVKSLQSPYSIKAQSGHVFLDKFSHSILINWRKLWKSNASLLGQKSAGWMRLLRARRLQGWPARRSLSGRSPPSLPHSRSTRAGPRGERLGTCRSPPGSALLLPPTPTLKPRGPSWG